MIPRTRTPRGATTSRKETSTKYGRDAALRAMPWAIAIVVAAIGGTVAVAGSRSDDDDVDAGANPPMTIDRLLDRHREARGVRWSEIAGTTCDGTWTAFSVDVPMTRKRARGDRYRFDHVLFDAPATLAYDGSKAWVRASALGAPGARTIEEPWARNVAEDARFGSMLAWHRRSGATLALAGRHRFEGRDQWIVEVEPVSGAAETWWIDVETALETRRVSRTWDVFSGAIEIEMETFYMDFREVVPGLRVPMREERHFGTRYHVYACDTVTVDDDPATGTFELPGAEPPP